MSRRDWQKASGAICLAMAVLTVAGLSGGSFHADTGQNASFPQWAVPPGPGRPSQHAIGIVDGVNAMDGTITIDYGPSQAMGWPSFIMVRYTVLDRQLLEGVVVGERVSISYRKRGYDLELIGLSAVAQQ